MAEINDGAISGDAIAANDVIGNDDTSNDSNNGTRDPGAAIAGKKRGRHPRECECDKCIARKSGSGTAAGNQPRAGTGKTQSSKALDLDALATQLVGAHQILALVLKNEIFKIDHDEAKRLALAVRNVAQHYNINVSPKALAWTQLVTIAGAIYGPKLGVMFMQYKIKRAEADRAAALGVPSNNAVKVSPANSGQFQYQ